MSSLMPYAMPSPDGGFTPTTGGLLVPTELINGLRKAGEERVRETRRQFFSQQSMHMAPTDFEKTDPGQFLSYYSAYQPWNLAGGYRKPSDSVPFQILREVRRKSVVDALIVDTRVTQMKHFARRVVVPHKQVGFRVVHERNDDPNFHETEDIRRRCDEVERRLLNVTPEFHNTVRDFLTMMVEEELTIDRKCIVIYRDRRGRPMRFHAIDGATVRPRLQVLVPFMFKEGIKNLDHAAEIFSDRHKIDITKAAYIQEVDGQIVAAWKADEMSVDWTNPQARINTYGYGVSQLEKSLEATRAFVYAWNYNVELFKTNYPEAILAVLGDYDPVGLENFKRQVLGETGPGSNWRLPVIPGGPADQFKAEVLKLRDTPQEMLFGELLRMLVAIKCAAFRMHPSEINFSTDMGAQSTIFGQGDTEHEVANAVEEGMHTMLDGIADWLNRAIVKQNYDDLVMVWEGLNRPDESTLITNLSAETAAYLTVDEARARRNLPKLKNDMGDYVNNPLYFQQQQAKMQEDMAKKQQEGYEQGDFGADPSKAMSGGQDEPQESQPGQGAPAQAMPMGVPEVPKGGSQQMQDQGTPGQMPPEGVPSGGKPAFQNPKAAGFAPSQKSLMSVEDYQKWKDTIQTPLRKSARTLSAANVSRAVGKERARALDAEQKLTKARQLLITVIEDGEEQREQYEKRGTRS